MDSPNVGVASPIPLRPGQSEGTAFRKVDLRVGDIVPEINKWLKLNNSSEEEVDERQQELEKKLKSEILSGLRELQKENDETAWMYG